MNDFPEKLAALYQGVVATRHDAESESERKKAKSAKHSAAVHKAQLKFWKQHARKVIPAVARPYLVEPQDLTNRAFDLFDTFEIQIPCCAPIYVYHNRGNEDTRPQFTVLTKCEYSMEDGVVRWVFRNGQLKFSTFVEALVVAREHFDVRLALEEKVQKEREAKLRKLEQKRAEENLRAERRKKLEILLHAPVNCPDDMKQILLCVANRLEAIGMILQREE